MPTEAEARLDADHDWALWYEKWRAQLDTTASYAERLMQSEAALDRVRALWPHIEVPFRDHEASLLVGVRDPGPPTCLRCKIEEAIRG